MKKDHGGNEFEDDEDDNDVSDSIAKSRESKKETHGKYANNYWQRNYD